MYKVVDDHEVKIVSVEELKRKMKLVETIQLKESEELRRLSHLCKNLFNIGNYYVKNYYDIMETYLNWFDTKWMLKTSEPFKQLPSQVAQNVLKNLHLAWKSYFGSLKKFKKNPQKWIEEHDSIPHTPNYLRKNGKYVACFNHQHICQTNALSENKMNRYLYFPKKTKLNPIEINSNFEEIQQFRIVPKNDIYNLEIVYNHITLSGLELDPNRIIGIDIGVNNLATIVNNVGLKPIAINGRPLKAINQFYNKEKARLQSEMSRQTIRECKRDFEGKIYKKNGTFTVNFVKYVERESEKRLYETPKMKKLSRIRYNKTKDYMHKASRYIINYCIENNIGTIVIGKNPLWKQKINLGKSTNQSFTQIPFNLLIEKLQYKADMVGIGIEIITEEYTSMCSFLDNETIGKQTVYKGRRFSRGLFKASDGRIINADVNGAYNILKKAFPKAILVDGIEGAQLHPLLINLNSKTRLIGLKTS